MIRIVLLGILLLPGCMGSGCNQPTPPSSDTCSADGTPRGEVTGVEIGRDLGDGFEPHPEGGVVPLVIGGQGSPMIVLNLRVTGSDLPGCLPQHTRAFLANGAVEASEEAPLRARQVGADTWVTGDLLLVSYGATAGEMIRIDAQVADVAASVQLWVDYEGEPAPDAGPDAF